MAKLIESGSSEAITTERRMSSHELRRLAEEKASVIEAEYHAKIAQGDYSDESFHEYAAKLNQVLRDYGDQILKTFGSA